MPPSCRSTPKYLDAAYKLVECDGRPMMELSSAEVTAPGAKQGFRGPGFTDTVALREEPASPGTRPLLEQVMAGGRRTGPPRPEERLRSVEAAAPGTWPG
ncbi:hypothetical protein ACIRYZ_37065 [Kitasatospora sp. NPDC101155]|uniref:hypothetical protein n=1 Tax=Kitasatospora sp. NPDC101155 TaxID=3364097 RepID=UPI00382C0A8F